MSANYRRLLLALLITAGVLNYADRQIIALLKPLLQEKLHRGDRDYRGLTAGVRVVSAGARPIRSPSASGASPPCFTPSHARWANLLWRVSRSVRRRHSARRPE